MYICRRCGREIFDDQPLYTFDGFDYHAECAFIDGAIDEEEYLSNYPKSWDIGRAVVHDGAVCIGSAGCVFPWEKTKNQQRKTPQYAEWRTAVFERDGYRCAICGEVGGRLNAHHIKPFARYPDLRLDVDNGITLCEECHKEVHRKKDKDEADRLDKTT